MSPVVERWWRRRRRYARPAAVMLCCGLATACASRPEPDARFAARQALAEAAERGPVRAVVRGPLFDLLETERDALVIDAIEDGIRGLDVAFTTDARDAARTQPRLVLVLDATELASAGLACRDPGRAAGAPGGDTFRVLAAFCEGDEPLGVARTEGQVDGPDDRDLRRLLWRAGNELFPDDYGSTYGFGLLPPWLGLGVEGSFGF